MQKRAPSKASLAAMVVFSLSCFAIVLFLWKTFGGPSPLAPNQYLVKANFDEATQLADTADVRISGVNVGHVTKTQETAGRTNVTMRIERRYAPIPRDTRAILRQKTLLGETYVELTPGEKSSGSLADGGTIPNSQVKPTVELDEILRALDPRTRRDSQRLLAALAESVKGRGESLNDALGNLGPLSDHSTELFGVLDDQRSAVRRLVHDSGVVFGSLAQRQGDLSGLVRSGDRVLSVTARRNRDLADVVRILPTTLQELRPTMADVRTLSLEARPTLRALRPAAGGLAPALKDTAALAPQVRAVFGDVDRVITESKTALPATQHLVEALHPVTKLLPPVLKEAYPVVQYLSLYKQEVLSQISLLGDSLEAATPSAPGGPPIHYLRALVPFTSEGLVTWDKREGTNRHNPYLLPRGLEKLAQGVDSFDCENVNNPSAQDPAPPCRVQQPLEFQGRRTAYPHVEPDR